MNDRRFIELLNLYIDDQIAPSEAAELEAEVMRCPRHRRVYDDYCRLQRGCSLLGDGSRALAPSSDAFSRFLRDAERKIAAPRRAGWRLSQPGVFSTAAMAACVAVVFVVHSRQTPTLGTRGQSVAVVHAEEPVAAVKVATAADRAVPKALLSTEVLPFEFQPVLNSSGISVARTAREAEIASMDREALEWMQRVELLPGTRLVVDEQAFDARPTLQQDNRVFRSRHSLNGNAGFTAFQFQR